MKILTLDQSTSCTGYSIFDNGELIEYGAIRPSKKICEVNMHSMFLRVADLIDKVNPDKILIEDVYLKMQKVYNPKTKSFEWRFNVATHKVLSNLQGMLIAYFVLHQIEFEVIHPSTWQKIIKKKGKVEKEDTKSFVNKKYSTNIKNDNVTDSIAIGLYYLSKSKTSKK